MWKNEWILILIMNVNQFSVMITILVSITHAHAKGERSESQETAADQLTKMVLSKPSATLKSLLASLFTKHSKPLLSNTHTKHENTLLRNLASKILVTSLGYKRSKTGGLKRPTDQVLDRSQNMNGSFKLPIKNEKGSFKLPMKTEKGSFKLPMKNEKGSFKLPMKNVKGSFKLPIKSLLLEPSYPTSNRSTTRSKDARKKKNGGNVASHFRNTTLTMENKTSSHHQNASDDAREARARRRHQMRYMGYLVNRLNEFYANISRMNVTSTRTKNVVHVPFRRREVNKLNQLFSSLVKQEADLYAQNRSKLGAMSRSKLRSFANLLKQLHTLPNGTARQVQFDLIIDSHNSTRKDYVVMDDTGVPRASNIADFPSDAVNDNVGNHLSDVDERSCYDCTMPTDSYMPDSRENDKLAQYILSQDILSVNNKLRGYASKYQQWNVHDLDFDESIRNGYGAPRNGYEAPRNGYVAPRNGYGAPRNGYGAPRNDDGAPRNDDGAPRNDYGAMRSGYEAARNGYAALRQSFGTSRDEYAIPRNDFVGSRNDFGGAKGRYPGLQTSYRASPIADPRASYGHLRNDYGPPRNEYVAPKTDYGTPTNNYGTARHSYGVQREPIHVMADGKNHYLSGYKQSTDNDRNHLMVDERHHAVALAEYSDNALAYGNRNSPFFDSNANGVSPADQAFLSTVRHHNNGMYHTNLGFGELPRRHEYRPKQYPVGLPLLTEFTGETREQHHHHPGGAYHHGSGRNNRVGGRNPYQEELDIGLTHGIADHTFEEQGRDDFRLVDKVVNEIFYRNPLTQHGNDIFDRDYFSRAKDESSKISDFQ